MYLVGKCSRSLTSFSKKDVILPFTSMTRRKNIPWDGVGYLLVPYQAFGAGSDLLLVDKLSLDKGLALVLILYLFWPSCKHALVAPQVLRTLSFFIMYCLAFWRWILWSFRNVVLSSFSFLSSSQQAMMEDISELEGPSAAIACKPQSPMLFHGNAACLTYSWDWLEVSVMCMLPDTMCVLDSGVHHACWPRCEVQGPVAYHEMLLRVVHARYLDHELFCYHFCVSCWILVGYKSKESHWRLWRTY